MRVIIFIIVVLFILAKAKFFKKRDHSGSDDGNQETNGSVNRNDVDEKYSASENLELPTETGSERKNIQYFCFPGITPLTPPLGFSTSPL